MSAPHDERELVTVVTGSTTLRAWVESVERGEEADDVPSFVSPLYLMRLKQRGLLLPKAPPEE
jgi:hypothetical protein